MVYTWRKCNGYSHQDIECSCLGCLGRNLSHTGCWLLHTACSPWRFHHGSLAQWTDACPHLSTALAALLSFLALCPSGVLDPACTISSVWFRIFKTVRQQADVRFQIEIVVIPQGLLLESFHTFFARLNCTLRDVLVIQQAVELGLWRQLGFLEPFPTIHVLVQIDPFCCNMSRCSSFLLILLCARKHSLEDYLQENPMMLAKSSNFRWTGALPKKSWYTFPCFEECTPVSCLLFSIFPEGDVHRTLESVKNHRNRVLLRSYPELQIACRVGCSTIFPSQVAVVPHVCL